MTYLAVSGSDVLTGTTEAKRPGFDCAFPTGLSQVTVSAKPLNAENAEVTRRFVEDCHNEVLREDSAFSASKSFDVSASI
jgi:hypothetical protein